MTTVGMILIGLGAMLIWSAMTGQDLREVIPAVLTNKQATA